jgi:hypothetical protein
MQKVGGVLACSLASAAKPFFALFRMVPVGICVEVAVDLDRFLLWTNAGALGRNRRWNCQS